MKNLNSKKRLDFDDKIAAINAVIRDFFIQNPSVSTIAAKELMPKFLNADIFNTNHRDGLPLRNLLRKLDSENQLHRIPSLMADRKSKNTYWYFVSKHINSEIVSNKKGSNKWNYKNKNSKKRGYSDEAYVIDLCDTILNLKASRQHKFDFLLGDLHKDGKTRSKLPVDAYYKELNIVIEYAEVQHTERVPFFDKPDKKTISGVSRDEQRKIYDLRRQKLIPENGIDLIVISYSDLTYNLKTNRLLRNRDTDLLRLKEILKNYIK